MPAAPTDKWGSQGPRPKKVAFGYKQEAHTGPRRGRGEEEGCPLNIQAVPVDIICICCCKQISASRQYMQNTPGAWV